MKMATPLSLVISSDPNSTPPSEATMKRFLRRIRGVIGTGLIWALGWAPLGALFVALTVDRTPLARYIALGAINGAIQGFLVGGSFAVVLSVVERHKQLEELSLGRVAAWGALGGFLLGIPFTLAFGVPLFSADGALTYLLGAGFAAGTVAIARKGGEEALIEGEDEPLLLHDEG
jgi:hypothetical protein